MLNILRGKFKGFYYVLGLHRLFGMFSRILTFMAQINQVSKWVNAQKNLKFNDFYTFSLDYSKRLSLYEFVFNAENLSDAFDYLEFGVANGNSFSWWLKRNQHPDTAFYGFDTFTGLPENWGDFKKGDMSAKGNMPKVDDPRCHFIKGLFQDTLFGFLKSHPLTRRKVIHMDADLYTSTLFVLTSMAPFLKKGDIIFFDEFNVPMHEFKAFKEFTDAYYIKYETLGGVNNFLQAAIKII